jgi:hypothetical protein
MKTTIPSTPRSFKYSLDSKLCAKILYTFIIFPMRVTYLTHLNLLNLTTLVMFGEEYKLCSSLFCNIFHPPKL